MVDSAVVFTQIYVIANDLFGLDKIRWDNIVSLKRCRNDEFHADENPDVLRRRLRAMIKTRLGADPSVVAAGSDLVRVLRPHTKAAIGVSADDDQ